MRTAVTRRSIPAALLVLCSLAGPARADTDPRAQALLGNPDGARSSSAERERFLVERPQYALSYNDRLRFPNWVAWHLNASDIGGSPRGQFQPDPSLLRGFTVVLPSDYTRSGYDRGHNCPSADRSANPGDNAAVFLMSNMTPQAHGMNAGPWEKLESTCRALAREGKELYVVCGHGFSSPTHGTIGRAKVAVPDFGWKVVVVLPDRPGDDLQRITSATRVIAIRVPNVNTVSHEDWTRYITTPAEIEQATGLKFFTALPPDTAAALRQKRDQEGGSASTRSRMRRGRGSGPSAGMGGAPRAAAAGKVWVNTRSGAYWRPGTKYYGKTKQGEYMTEGEARKAGYHAAGGQ